MAELVAPGGQIAAYVYRKKALLRELADEHIIDETSRLSVDECLELSEQITELGRELSRLGAKVKLERGVPLLGIEPGEHDVQRLIYWTMLKCFWNEELGWHQSVMINYDWYSPVYRSRHTEEEVLGWCRDAGLEVVNLDVIESGISVRAARPLDAAGCAAAHPGSRVRALEEGTAPVLEAEQRPQQQTPVLASLEVILDEWANPCWVEVLVNRRIGREQQIAHVIDAVPPEPAGVGP